MTKVKLLLKGYIECRAGNFTPSVEVWHGKKRTDSKIWGRSTKERENAETQVKQMLADAHRHFGTDYTVFEVIGWKY